MESPDEIKAHQMMERWETRKGGFWGRWSCQISFKKSSSRVEGERPSSGVARQARGKGFGMVACQSVIRE
jgi:hypothetical protein